jgi:Zn-dependent protease/predicted transcriptional regulator
MFGRSFKVARIGGIDIEIHPSWLIILALIAYTLSDGWFPDQYDHWSTAAYWIVGISASVLFFVTVLVHELAHAAVAIRRGLPVPKITLFIFGGVSTVAEQPRTAGEEFAIAAAGPATSLLIAIVTGLLGFALGSYEKAEGLLLYLAIVNLLLAVFNILPGFPLDGGRVLRSIIWGRTKSLPQATRIATGVGEMFGYVLMFAGGFLLLAGYIFDGIWLIFIGWFLHGAARAEGQGTRLERTLHGLTARDVMRADFPTVSPGDSIQGIVDHHMLQTGERAVMVSRDDAVLGILTVSDIKHIPREDWANTPVQGVMTPRDKIVTVSADAGALEALNLIAKNGLNQVPVLDNGRMIGLIARRELVERIHLAEQLAPVSGAPPAA